MGLKKWLSHPLLHFFVLGAGLFVLYDLLNASRQEAEVILIDDDIVNRNINIFQKEWGRRPEPEELKGLMENQIRQEVYYRQALKMNLDHNDELVKRRMQQKLSFITHDLANLKEPSEDSLKAYYQRNRSKYQGQSKVSFSQVYFNPDKRKDPLADAVSLLRTSTFQQSSRTSWQDFGDPFQFSQSIEGVTKKALMDVMGLSFADTLFALSPGKWHGPVLSGYGVHLVFVHGIQHEGEPEWNKIRPDLLRDYQFDASEQLNENVYRDFRKQYKVKLVLRDSATRKYELGKKLQADEIQ